MFARLNRIETLLGQVIDEIRDVQRPRAIDVRYHIKTDAEKPLPPGDYRCTVESIAMEHPARQHAERELPELDKVPSWLPDGIYRLVLAHSTTATSQHGKRHQRCVFVVVDGPNSGALVPGFLMWPEDGPNASWVWDGVVEHPRDLEPGSIVFSHITEDDYRGQRRSRLGKLTAMV